MFMLGGEGVFVQGTAVPLLLMREKREQRAEGKGSGLEWLREKFGVSSGGDGENRRFGAEGGDLTSVSSGPLRLQPGRGRADTLGGARDDGKNRQLAVLEVSAGGCTGVLAVEVGELVGFWISF